MKLTGWVGETQFSTPKQATYGRQLTKLCEAMSGFEIASTELINGKLKQENLPFMMAFEKLGARWFVVLTSPVEIYFYFRTFSLHDLLEPGDDLLLRSPVLHQVETVNPITFVTMQYFFVNKKPIRYTPLGIANKNSDFI